MFSPLRFMWKGYSVICLQQEMVFVQIKKKFGCSSRIMTNIRCKSRAVNNNKTAKDFVRLKNNKATSDLWKDKKIYGMEATISFS